MDARKTCRPERWNLLRLAASALVLGGGLFWAWVVFVGSRFLDGATTAASGSAGVWVMLTAVVFLVGLYWERLAALVLGLTAMAAAGYGLFMHWESGVWLQFGLWIVVPILISGVLYMLAAREHTVCDLEARMDDGGIPATPVS
jgi:hypothetical protein